VLGKLVARAKLAEIFGSVLAKIRDIFMPL
jgi:hypothetical protein